MPRYAHVVVVEAPDEDRAFDIVAQAGRNDDVKYVSSGRLVYNVDEYSTTHERLPSATKLVLWEHGADVPRHPINLTWSDRRRS